MSDLHVTLDRDPSPADVAAVQAGLRAFNVRHIGDPSETPVSAFLRDDAGRVVGGLLGIVKWRWLYVAKLWVDDTHRSGGHGRALLAAAEDEARAMGCLGVYLDTFEYQARPFYEKCGYTLYGTLEGFPPGYRQFYLSKRLG